VITASTGNHGQGVAYAGGRLGVNVTIVAPRTLDPTKQAAMQDLGAQVLIEGDDINESSERAMQLAERQGLVYVEDGDDVALLTGAATVLWEMIDDRTDLDSVIVPVGGGNLIASCLWLAQVLESAVTVVGVQSAKAPGATLSWLRGTMTEADCRTAAGGLATRRPGALALNIMDAYLRQMTVVDEEELAPAVVRTLSTTGLAVELAAASGIAALDRFGGQLPGEVTGVVLTGGWIAPDALAKLLTR
jgi:threonine dehydratase